MTMAWRLFNRAVYSGEGGGSAGTGAAATGTDSTATTAAATDTKAAAPVLTTTALTDGAADSAKATDTKATATDSKADVGDKGAADTKDKAAADAPIVYTDFTLPEGVEVDAPTLDAAKALFAESKLPQEQAQKYVDFYQSKVTEAMQAPVKAWLDLNEKWTKDLKADKEIGGDRLTKTIAAGHKAMREFGSPALLEALIVTGAGNHPEVIRFFAAVGARTGEDTTVASNPTTEVMRTADVMFPTMKKE